MASEEMTLLYNVVSENGKFEIKDFDSVKAQLTDIISKNAIPEINEDTYSLAKNLKARYGKLSKAIDDKRKNDEKAYMSVFDPEKKQSKELIGLINDAVKPLTEGINAIDERAKAEKKEELETLFNSENTYPISFDQILDSSWLNKSSKLDDAKKAIADRLVQIEKDVALIRLTLEGNVQRYALCFYFKSLDMTASVEKANALVEDLRSVDKFLAK